MTASVLANIQSNNYDKLSLKLKYKNLKAGTDDKFEDWIANVEDCWLEEIAACLQGNFPDWRG
ncbi:MAG TPA: hypothetical protein DDZ80_18535 [Cyanobacteria bacterium UBA8803]|nr:hypothetical protein [Cyanobacteria bacterium UBA9273]HBL60377.1 hypothetical protein [Cyanobacteria bacterium UBA8803]